MNTRIAERCQAPEITFLGLGSGDAMQWLDAVSNPKSVSSLYKSAPSLEDIRVLEIILHEDGIRLQMRIDLKELPNPLPERWVRNEVNCAQIELWFSPLSHFEMKGWSYDNIASIEIEKLADGCFTVMMRGSTCFLQARFEHLYVQKLSGYCQIVEPESP